MTRGPTTMARHAIALAETSHGPGGLTDVEVVQLRPGALTDGDADLIDALVQAVRAIAQKTDAVRLVVDLPVDDDLPVMTRVADRLGLTAHRDLYQLRRSLPMPQDPLERPSTTLPMRPFDPDRDTDAWVRQNNRAFASHPDQGTQTPASLAATLAEPWVDLAGFLVADDPDRPGELAGSCWTRYHPATDTDPELGEIFVIGVDPAWHGRGLGTHLVLAGLGHLADRGIATAMLYVDATNEPARRLYRRLGFEPHLRRRLSSAPAETATT